MRKGGVRSARQKPVRLPLRTAADPADLRLRTGPVRPLPAATAAPAEPTPREREIRHPPATGLDSAEIARDPDISVSTVKKHITGIFGTLDVRDRAQAVIAACESGLVAAGGMSS